VIVIDSVAERLKRGETAVAERYDAATIVFADLVGVCCYLLLLLFSLCAVNTDGYQHDCFRVDGFHE
jgi:hypothetical protein